MPPTEPTHWLRTPALVLLLFYWFAMVVGTHWPRPPELLHSQSDKLLHLTAYFGLALLVCLNGSMWRPQRWRQRLAVIATLLAIGVVDELTQIPVGRDANIFDWLADCLGTLAGVGLFAVLGSLFRRQHERVPTTP